MNKAEYIFEKFSGIQAKFYKEIKPVALELLNVRKVKELAPGKRDAKILETLDKIVKKYSKEKSIHGILGFGPKSKMKQLQPPKNFALKNMQKQWTQKYGK